MLRSSLIAINIVWLTACVSACRPAASPTGKHQDAHAHGHHTHTHHNHHHGEHHHDHAHNHSHGGHVHHHGGHSHSHGGHHHEHEHGHNHSHGHGHSHGQGQPKVEPVHGGTLTAIGTYDGKTVYAEVVIHPDHTVHLYFLAEEDSTLSVLQQPEIELIVQRDPEPSVYRSRVIKLQRTDVPTKFSGQLPSNMAESPRLVFIFPKIELAEKRHSCEMIMNRTFETASNQ